MNVDLSRIDNLEDRQAAKAKLDERDLLIAERDAALAPILERYQAARKALRERHDEETLALCRPFEDELQTASGTLDDQINDIENDLSDFEWDWDACKLVTCALTGLPLYEVDARFTNDQTGEVILRAALGLPGDEPAAAATAETVEAAG